MGAAVVCGEPLGLSDVVGDDRTVERDLRPVALDRRCRRLDVLGREPRVSRDVPVFALRLVEPQGVGVGRERAACEVEDLRKHRLDAERAKQGGRGLQQQAEPLDLVGEKPVVF
jgi:hypothetical protein